MAVLVVFGGISSIPTVCVRVRVSFACLVYVLG